MDNKIISFAIEAHSKTNHLYDGKPYSVHLAMVVRYANYYMPKHLSDEIKEVIINSCWLHDTIEDCRLTYNDVKNIAGEQVADIVYALTNNKGKNRKERAGKDYYEGIRNTPNATFVKLCDRLANARYSLDTGSKMFEVYKKENNYFMDMLFPFLAPAQFVEMNKELYSMLTN